MSASALEARSEVDTGQQWRYIAQRYSRDNPLGDFLDFNLPLQGVEIDDVLSGHNGLNAKISPEYARLKASDGKPLLEEWGTLIWAESPDGELYGGILKHSGFSGPDWDLEVIDVTGAAIDLPYTEANYFVNVDPLDLYRHIWQYIQSQPGGNLGIFIDSTVSPVRLGTDLIQKYPDVAEGFDNEPDPTEELETTPVPVAPNPYKNNGDWKAAGIKAMTAVHWKKKPVEDALSVYLNNEGNKLDKDQKTIVTKTKEKIGVAPKPPAWDKTKPVAATVAPAAEEPAAPSPVAGEAQPVFEYDAYKLSWYEDHDLSTNLDDLSEATPFDYHARHYWVSGPNGDEIRHHIRLGYPRLGRRRDDLRFVVGENIWETPDVERDGEEYANEVLVLGKGEGAAMVRGRAYRNDPGRMRRVAVISAPEIGDNASADRRAAAELAKRFNIDDITDIIMRNHPHAPVGAVDVGDEILIEGDLGWIELEVWCRVLSRSISPENGDAMGLSLIRSDRLA